MERRWARSSQEIQRLVSTELSTSPPKHSDINYSGDKRSIRDPLSLAMTHVSERWGGSALIITAVSPTSLNAVA